MRGGGDCVDNICSSISVFRCFSFGHVWYVREVWTVVECLLLFNIISPNQVRLCIVLLSCHMCLN